MNLKDRLNLSFAKKTKSLILLGATGSIGNTTLKYLRRNKEIQLKAISVHKSIDKLNQIIDEFHPEFVAISDEESYDKFIKNYHNSKIKFFKGEEGLVELIRSCDADTVLTAVVGSVGLIATIEAIKQKKKICLANKETLITGGELILNLLEQYKAPMIPVDSEHNASFQLLVYENIKNIRKLILTASGGALRDMTTEQIKIVTKKEVLNHPSWKMGAKITVDSAGLINKGLEVIEAHYLFGIPYENIDVKIHRSSYVHAMIQLNDGSYKTLISPPDMIFPISHSLNYPESMIQQLQEYEEPEDWPGLYFEKVDLNKYPGFMVCLKAGMMGKSAPCILNASNEIAVDLFLHDKIHFTEIPEIITDALDHIPLVDMNKLDIIINIDKQTREYVLKNYNKLQMKL